MNEAELQRAVIELARLFRWRVAHFRPALTVNGYRTPVEGDGKGFPDLVLVRAERVVFAELKSDRGKLTDEQDDWLTALSRSVAEVYLWTPANWFDGRIEATLRD